MATPKIDWLGYGGQEFFATVENDAIEWDHLDVFQSFKIDLNSKMGDGPVGQEFLEKAIFKGSEISEYLLAQGFRLKDPEYSLMELIRRSSPDEAKLILTYHDEINLSFGFIEGCYLTIDPQLLAMILEANPSSKTAIKQKLEERIKEWNKFLDL